MKIYALQSLAGGFLDERKEKKKKEKGSGDNDNLISPMIKSLQGA